jgi:hypothetical protein
MESRSRQKVLIASVNPWSFCMAVERDLIADNGDKTVDAIDLFRLCSRASPHWRPRDKLIETLNREIQRFVMPAINGRDITRHVRIHRGRLPPLPATYDELRSYELDGAKVGLAVLSSVSSLTTIQYPSILEEYGSVLEPAWRSAHHSLRIGQAVQGMGYDKIYIFNGRHCHSRPFCDVLDQSAEVIRYEQGSAGNRYIAARGSVHHPVALSAMIEAHDFDRSAGEAFYRERLDKDARTEVSLLTAQQRTGILPKGVEPGRTVAFFTSSSDEMFAVTDDPLYGSFPNQHEIAVALSDACRAQGLQLVVRLHPHLRFKHPAWRREWDFDDLRRRGVTILDATDPCDSYALVRASRCVITAGSTVGLEASYLGIPNAVVGTWVTGRLGACVELHTAEEIAAFVANPTLPPQSRERALLYGSFYKTAGKLLPHLDVGPHPNLARIDGQVVDRVRYTVQKLRFLFRPPPDPNALDVRSGMHGGRVLLPPGTDYSSALKR